MAAQPRRLREELTEWEHSFVMKQVRAARARRRCSPADDAAAMRAADYRGSLLLRLPVPAELVAAELPRPGQEQLCADGCPLRARRRREQPRPDRLLPGCCRTGRCFRPRALCPLGEDGLDPLLAAARPAVDDAAREAVPRVGLLGCHPGWRLERLLRTAQRR